MISGRIKILQDNRINSLRNYLTDNDYKRRNNNKLNKINIMKIL
jgi:hypothetical protein